MRQVALTPTPLLPPSPRFSPSLRPRLNPAFSPSPFPFLATALPAISASPDHLPRRVTLRLSALTPPPPPHSSSRRAYLPSFPPVSPLIYPPFTHCHPDLISTSSAYFSRSHSTSLPLIYRLLSVALLRPLLVLSCPLPPMQSPDLIWHGVHLYRRLLLHWFHGNSASLPSRLILIDEFEKLFL
jgi:hypothetical protein